MRITRITRKEELLEKYDYRDFITLKVDGERKFNVSDGEPEDANLGRDFSDCHSIVDLMKSAYEAGKRGEEFVVEDESGEY